ncbi:hypothetical protein Bhyg_09582 [Pseudolycoriella hygida]|uniref:Uncharacterized protein n=1 Tax=Pseudolycoriella hygida TaxID=35572 RepID=A0A9Q0N6U0_9DIPT|nr:hypothetical protein Bhyg_09582 [Pseudolycoriella hygida]
MDLFKTNFLSIWWEINLIETRSKANTFFKGNCKEILTAATVLLVGTRNWPDKLDKCESLYNHLFNLPLLPAHDQLSEKPCIV